MFNFGKYMFSINTAILSYLYSTAGSLMNWWLLSAGISTIYSYIWDIKMDWGFLDPKSEHRFLRPMLCYQNTKFYYFAIVTNLILRYILLWWKGG